jgi:excisionase family DNA binding protein
MTRQTQVSTGRDVEAGFGQVRGRRQRGGIPRHYTIQEVAELLNVSHRTVRRWIANDDLVATRVHGVVRISDDDLRVFLALHREA